MKLCHNKIFKSVLLFLVLFAFVILSALLLIRIFPEYNTRNLMLLAIDFSFIVCIFLGFKLLKPVSSICINFKSTFYYFLLFISVCFLWFLVSPIFVFSQPNFTIDLKFSLKRLQDSIDTSTFFSYYSLFRILFLTVVLEEIFYRKIILSSLLEKYNPFVSILISSILFSIGHTDFDNSIYYLIGGILIGTFYWKTRNIYLTILLHMFTNFLTVFYI